MTARNEQRTTVTSSKEDDSGCGSDATVPLHHVEQYY